MSDELALGIVQGATDAGVAVPGDLTVTGFDDTGAAARAGLTTVRQPLRDEGVRPGEQVLAPARRGGPAAGDPADGAGGAVLQRATPAPRAGRRAGAGRP